MTGGGVSRPFFLPPAGGNHPGAMRQQHTNQPGGCQPPPKGASDQGTHQPARSHAPAPPYLEFLPMPKKPPSGGSQTLIIYTIVKTPGFGAEPQLNNHRRYQNKNKGDEHLFSEKRFWYPRTASIFLLPQLILYYFQCASR